MCLKSVYELDLENMSHQAKYSSSLTLEVCTYGVRDNLLTDLCVVLVSGAVLSGGAGEPVQEGGGREVKK